VCSPTILGAGANRYVRPKIRHNQNRSLSTEAHKFYCFLESKPLDLLPCAKSEGLDSIILI